MGVRAFGHVSEVEPGDWYRVDERGQDPGQELDCRELLQSMKQVPGGLDPHVVQVAEGHQANGYAVTLVTPTPPGNLTIQLKSLSSPSCHV